MKIRNVFGTEFSGTIGESMIASSWHGRPYVKAYAVPRNPRTESQQANRSKFGAAKVPWRELSDEERAAWNRAANGESGWNLFVGEFMRTDGKPGRLPPSGRTHARTAPPTKKNP